MFSPSDEPTEAIKLYQSYQSRLRSVSSTNRPSLLPQDSAQQRLKFEDSNIFKSPTDDQWTHRLKRSASQTSTGFSSRLWTSRRESENLDLSGPSPSKRFFKNEEIETMKSELESLKTKLLLKEAEVANASAANIKLQKRVETLEMNAKTENHSFENKLIQFRRELANIKSSKENAENELGVLKKKMKAEQDVEIGGKLNESRRLTEMENRMAELIKQNNDVNILNGKLNFEIGALKAKEEERFAALNSQLSNANSIIEEMKDRQKLAESQAQRHNEERCEIGSLRAEKESLELQLKQAKEELSAKKDDVSQRTDRIAQLIEYTKLVDENETLRRQNKLLIQTAENTNLLEQKLKSANASLAAAEQKVALGEKAILELNLAQHQLNQWQSAGLMLLSNEEQETLGSSPMNVDLFTQKLTLFQKEHMVQLHELKEANLKLKDEAAKVRDRDSKIDSLNEMILSEKVLKAREEGNVKKLARKLALVVQERDSYKKILDSYEHELTITGSQFDEDRLGVLKDLNTRQQSTIEELEKKVALLGQVQAEYEKLKLVESRLEKVSYERDELEFEMKRREMKGDYNPLKTKVLHFRNNPAAQANEEYNVSYEKLQRENQSLKTRVKLLEDGVTKDLTLLVGDKVSESGSCKSLEDMREELRSSEIRRQRIIEVFKKTSRDYREAVMRLTGYRVDTNSNQDVYKLYPIYNENPGDVLMFKKDAEGEMHLMESELLASKEDLINLHLKRQHSVPVFLAALLLDLFSKQTFDTADTFVDTYDLGDTLYNVGAIEFEEDRAKERLPENTVQEVQVFERETQEAKEAASPEEDPAIEEDPQMEIEEVEDEAEEEEAEEEEAGEEEAEEEEAGEEEAEEEEAEEEEAEEEQDVESDYEEINESDESESEDENRKPQPSYDDSDDDVIIIDE